MMVVIRYHEGGVRLELKPCRLKLEEIVNMIKYNTFFNPWRILVPEDSRSIQVADVYLLAKSSCYESGLGLKIWS